MEDKYWLASQLRNNPKSHRIVLKVTIDYQVIIDFTLLVKKKQNWSKLEEVFMGEFVSIKAEPL